MAGVSVLWIMQLTIISTCKIDMILTEASGVVFFSGEVYQKQSH